MQETSTTAAEAREVLAKVRRRTIRVAVIGDRQRCVIHWPNAEPAIAADPAEALERIQDSDRRAAERNGAGAITMIEWDSDRDGFEPPSA